MRSRTDWYRIAVTLVAVAWLTFAVVLFAPIAQGTGDDPQSECHYTEYRVVKQVKKYGGWKTAEGAVAYDSGWVTEQPDITDRPGGPWVIGEKKRIAGKWYRYTEETREVYYTCPTTPTTPTTTTAPTTTVPEEPTTTTSSTLPDSSTTTIADTTTTSTDPAPTTTVPTTTLETPTEWDASATCSEMTTFNWGEGIIAVEVFSMDHLGQPQTDAVASTFLFSGEVFTQKVASAHLFTLIPVVEPGFVAVPAQIELIVDECAPETTLAPPEAPQTPSTPDLEELPYTGLPLHVWAIVGLVALAVGGFLVRVVGEGRTLTGETE